MTGKPLAASFSADAGEAMASATAVSTLSARDAGTRSHALVGLLRYVMPALVSEGLGAT